MSENLDARLDKIDKSHEQLHNLISEIEDILGTLITNDTEILEAMAQMISGFPQIQARNEQRQAKLVEDIRAELRSFLLALAQQNQSLATSSAGPAPIPARDDFAKNNPEVGLLQYLYSFLPINVALDIGANRGDVSERLLTTGYTVYAFEPAPATFEALRKRFAAEKSFFAFPYALGSQDTTMDLNMAEDPSGQAAAKYGDPSLFSSLVEHPMPGDLPFNKRVPVQVRSLDSLRRSGEIPARIGVLKIDTEGFDLEVVRGLAAADETPVVMTEFWDAEHSFGRTGKGQLGEMVREMRGRGYHWHIVLSHNDAGAVSYFCNESRTFSNTWGNALFFREQPLFLRAYGWCEKVLASPSAA